MIAYARALGDAQTGDTAGAEAEIGRLQSLEDKLKGNDRAQGRIPEPLRR